MSDPAAAAQPEGVVEAAAVPQEGAPAEAALDPAVAQGLTDPAQLAAYQAMLQAGAFGFGQPFGYLPGFGLPMGAFGLPGGEGETKTEGQEEGEDETDDEEEAPDDDSDSDGRPKRKRAARSRSAKKGDVKSQSSAALAILAGAAAKPSSAAAAAAAAAMQQNLGELWGTINGGAAGLAAGASGIDLSKLSTEQQQQLLANPDYAGMTDDREIKRLRRKQSNRESARRSRLRKQAETELLARQVKDLITENARLKEEKMGLVAQIEILNAKLSMSAFGAMHGLAGEAPKLAAQAQDMQSVQMAAAMAQAMGVNSGAMLGAAGLGIPALDAKPLDGTDTDAAAAAAAAAAAVATGVDPSAVAAAQGVEA